MFYLLVYLKKIVEVVGGIKFFCFILGQEASSSQAVDQLLRRLQEMYVVFDFEAKGFVANDSKFFIKRPETFLNIPFYDNETDCIVLELQERNSAGEPLPDPFKKFCIPPYDGGVFHFISHSGGEPKHTDKVEIIVDPESEEAKKDIENFRSISEHFLKDRGIDPYLYKFEGGNENIITNPKRILFRTDLGKGGSGSPGFVIMNNELYIASMLLRGYPEWYFNDDLRGLREHWDHFWLVEQGANMKYVYSAMKTKNSELFNNIFVEN